MNAWDRRTPKYTVTVAVHNRLDLVRPCVEAISRHADYETHVVIMDNASTDGAREFLQEFTAAQNAKGGPLWILVENQQNLGFICSHRAVYEGGLVKSPYLCFVNSDVQVCEGWQEKLRAPMKADPMVALVGLGGMPSELRADGCGVPGSKLEYVELSCAMLDMEVVNAQWGYLFAPWLKRMYTDDADLSLRLRSRGYRLATVRLPVVFQRAASREIGKKTLDIDGFEIRNRTILVETWKDYFRNPARKFLHEVDVQLKPTVPVIKDKLVIKRNGAAGDVLMATSVIAALRKKYPKANITVATANGVMLQKNPHINGIVPTTHVKGRPLQGFIDLDDCYERSPQRHPAISYAEAAGVLEEMGPWTAGNELWRPQLFSHVEARPWAASQLQGDRWLVVHPGPSWPSRTYPMGHWQDVIRHFMGFGWKVVLVGHKAGPLDHTLDLRGVTTIPQLGALMERVDLFIGIDAMPMHVAQAMSRPIVAVFGAIAARYRLLPDPWVEGVTANPDMVGCLECHHYQAAPRRDSKCIRPHPTNPPLCMTALLPIDVVRACERVLATQEKRVEAEVPA